MPVTIKSTGGGSVTMTAASTASDFTLTLPAVTGTVLQSGTAVTAAQGGTGQTSLTANNVLLGNGTSAVQFVAPGTNGNVLTSNGTTWTSAAPAASSVTSLTAGNGITVSASTGAVTVSQDIYTGSTSTNLSYPIGTVVLAYGTTITVLASSQTVSISASSSPDEFRKGSTGFGNLTGTWRARGQFTSNATDFGTLFQRTA